MFPTRSALWSGRVVRLVTAAVAIATAALGPGLVAGSAAAAPAPRSFTCQGSLGEAYTQRTVTGQLTATARPFHVTVIATSTGVTESHRTTKAGAMGVSDMRPGYVKWNVTGTNPDHNYYRLHLPPVLPGQGGFFDAQLDIEFNRGTAGGWQIPMFDCTVSGGSPDLAHPPSPRAFTCEGALGEPFTRRTVTGLLNANNRPYAVSVTATSTGAVESTRDRLAGNRGASWLHTGYVDWNITGPNVNHNYYRLHLAPVLPAVGGFFDADLEMLFNRGTQGAWQIPMFDCTVTAPPA